MNVIGQMLRFITNPQYDFAGQTLTTLKLCLVPIAISIAIALPLGILVAQRPVLAFAATNFSGLVRAIPTFAVLLAIVLIFKQIGFTPSVIALTALGIPPILLNTIAGMRGVDPAAVDAARGMGMTALQVLIRIQIPLILPVVAAGVRNAAVQIVATVPLASLIGGGGYGDYVFLGLSTEVHTDALLVGGIGIALLALITEGALAIVQRAVTPAGLRTSALATPTSAVEVVSLSSKQPRVA
jgi:osmoprotectant transport system permease protein